MSSTHQVVPGKLCNSTMAAVSGSSVRVAHAVIEIEINRDSIVVLMIF
jgi:hypothetical protein